MPVPNKILPSYYLYPLLILIPTGYVIVCRKLFESSSNVQYLGKSWAFLVAIFLQFCEYCFIGMCQYWLYRLFVQKLHFPALILDIFFIPLYLEVFGFSLYDFENGRHNMQMVLVSHYHAYLGRFGMKDVQRRPPLSTIIGLRSKQGSAAQVAGMTILDSPAFWISVILVFIIWLAYIIHLAIKFWDNIKLAAMVKIQPIKNGMPTASMIMQSKVASQTWIPQHRYKNPMFIIYSVCAIIDVLYLIYIFDIADEKIKFVPYMPYSHALFLTLTHFEKHPSNIKNVANVSRTYLPAGRYWLDQRSDPVYPAVHADLKTFCAYNPNDSKCSDYKLLEVGDPILTEAEMPNVVTIIWESFTPIAYLINTTFLDEHAAATINDPEFYITNTSYYNRDILSGVSDLADNGVTFSGMSSFGVPTLSGWHGFMTGLTAAQTYVNIIDGTNIQSDDLPSLMRDIGYRTMYVSPARFDFDGKDTWVYRRPAIEEAMTALNCSELYEEYFNDSLQQALQLVKPQLRNCSANPSLMKKVKELTAIFKSKELDAPKWWDYIVSYYPIKQFQSESLGIAAESLSNHAHWVPDRITAKQFQAHWLQQKDILRRFNRTQPIYGSQLTVESHLPYLGYDKMHYYDPIPPTVEPNTNEHRAARWIRVNKYTDRYLIKETIKFLRENDPNTIFIMTGDHSGRDLPVREKNSKITPNTVFEGSCVHESTGPDVFFSTSGVISYLGNDTRIEKALGLDKLKGKTLNFPCDHNDLVYTVIETLSKLSGKPIPPTYRRSRNLIDLSVNISNAANKPKKLKKIVKSIDDSNWQSVAAVTFVMEYKNGTRFIRTHPGDPEGAHYYNETSFPTCINTVKSKKEKAQIGTKKSIGMYHDMFKFISAENYLTYNNRMYNFAFRNMACVEQGKCEFPEPGKPIHFDDNTIGIVIFGFPVLFLLLFALPAETFACLYQLYFIKHSNDNFLEDQTEFCEEEYKEGKPI